ncbi:putative sucrose:sucrose fructosyltransferase [Helianthus annuus]|nr:putative sucrose:sucrose fructosyltransferase [Helianthus annuus]KAJ0475112.1 putative sucrose:sucrose fructosyltransferase [Helianthus annuus]KAJ0650667.1 putative sucrose:sucrose fructosyltransferase [Helianthus annuus]KAJ0654421.1 putative sucrose:sucrose fructosyltransferase [Helianthus annuus]
MGWYHLFYQYNPHSAIWGNITWGHAVSKDLINWFHLPLAMVPDHWYDLKGVMTGSATVLPDGRIMMYYTGNAQDLSQLQCVAYPANSSDPLLVEWVKYEHNPILAPPLGVGLKDFRDPSTLWIGPDGKYRMVMGSKHDNNIGCALIYHTTNFTHFELSDEVLHSVPGTGMWECVDLYPISTRDTYGLEMSSYESDAKYVLKQSGDDDRHDWYAIGTYDPVKDKWYPDDPEMDVGIGLRYDYGKFYASKTFYDPSKRRRVLWGYVGETDLQQNDLKKGWANMLNVPRTVVLDPKTQSNLLQWPVEEIETLRSKKYHEFKDVELRPGSLVPLDIGSTAEVIIHKLVGFLVRYGEYSVDIGSVHYSSGMILTIGKTNERDMPNRISTRILYGIGNPKNSTGTGTNTLISSMVPIILIPVPMLLGRNQFGLSRHFYSTGTRIPYDTENKTLFFEYLIGYSTFFKTLQMQEKSI